MPMGYNVPGYVRESTPIPLVARCILKTNLPKTKLFLLPFNLFLAKISIPQYLPYLKHLPILQLSRRKFKHRKITRCHWWSINTIFKLKSGEIETFRVCVFFYRMSQVSSQPLYTSGKVSVGVTAVEYEVFGLVVQEEHVLVGTIAGI